MSDKEIDPEFGQWVSDTRKLFGMTQREFADATGLTPAHISHIETGTRRPTVAVVVAVTRVFGMDTEFGLRKAGLIPRDQPAHHAVQSLMGQLVALARQLDREGLQNLIEFTTAFLIVRRKQRQKPDAGDAPKGSEHL